MIILGIETSCDETAAAILEGSEKLANFSSLKKKDEIHTTNHPNLKLLSNVVVSQIDIFKAYGGVIPEVAARSHLEAIMPVIHQAFQDAKLQNPDGTDNWSKIDAIAVTHTPGLLGSLLVGTLTARTLAILHDKPLYAVHLLKSHIYANWLKDIKTMPAIQLEATNGQNPFPAFPLLALVISGGHTQILYMRKHNHFDIVGTTYDDAVGECLDKAAKILGLPYPGGPAISKAALGEITKADTGELIKVQPGDRQKYQFPHPHLNNPLDFSFSGLKTAFLRTVQKIVHVPISHPSSDLKNLLEPQQIADLAASFEQAVVDILLENLAKAHEFYPNIKSIVYAGGVSANALLRKKGSGFFPLPKFSGDNGAMVATACYFEILNGVQPTDPYSLNILPRSVIS